MRRIGRWVAPGAVLVLTFVMMGPQGCPNAEVCDGIDNDNDGLVDEDFDLDGDGHYSSAECSYGDDCDDANPGVYVWAPEVEDGVDNDCDGKIDEPTARYEMIFIDQYDNSPLPGIPVWVGVDGKGPAAVTDENGSAVFYLESPITSWSYGANSERQRFNGTKEYRSYVYSFLNQPGLGAVNTIYLGSPYAGESVALTGTVSGVDTSLTDSTLYVYPGSPYGNTYYSYAPETDAVDYSVSYGGLSFILAAQQPYLESYGGPNPTGIPAAYDLVLAPTDPADMRLSRTFDQLVTFAMNGVDSQMTTAEHSQSIVFPNRLGDVEFYGEYLDMADPKASILPIPTLDGPLTGAQMMLMTQVSSSDLRFTQGAAVPWLGGTGTVNVNLPVLPVVDLHPLVTNDDIPGTAINPTNDEKGDAQLLWYNDVENDASGNTYIHYWYVEQYDLTKAVWFPEIPNTDFVWPDTGEETDRDTVGQAAACWVGYGTGDAQPGDAYSLAVLLQGDIEAPEARSVQRLTRDGASWTFSPKE